MINDSKEIKEIIDKIDNLTKEQLDSAIEATDKIKIEPSKNVKQVLVLIDNLIGGKRFGELDSAKQMYLLDCQCKIDAISRGECTEADIVFILETIDSLTKTLFAAKDELENMLY